MNYLIYSYTENKDKNVCTSNEYKIQINCASIITDTISDNNTQTTTKDRSMKCNFDITSMLTHLDLRFIKPFHHAPSSKIS